MIIYYLTTHKMGCFARARLHARAASPYARSLVTRAIYCACASSLLVPLTLFQASHLALPSKSKKPDGLSMLQSPTVTCK